MPQLTNAPLPAGRFRDQDQPTLGADRLTLRPWRLSDSAAVAAAYCDPAIQHWHARSMTDAEAREWIASWSRRWTVETGAGWAVTRGGELVGRTSFGINREAACGEAAYWVVPAARGCDIAAQALRIASVWMLSSGGLHRLELNHSTANQASCRVAGRAGYAYEGTRRQQALHQDGWHDMHMHALLADDLAQG